MCLISYYPPGVMPIQAELENGIEVNDDGAGFAIVTGGDTRMLMAKDAVHPEVTLGMFMSFRKRFPDGPAVFHSRLSTGSAVSFANTHPIPVGGDVQTLLFHNGSLDIPLEPGESDTVKLAEQILPKLSLDSPLHTRLIEVTIERANNKAVVLTSNPKWQEQAYVYNRSQWIVTPEGALHSNADFLGKGIGWDEETYAGDLYRWRILQDNQCPVCHRYHAGDLISDLVRNVHPGPEAATLHPAYRNESERRRKVEAAS